MKDRALQMVLELEQQREDECAREFAQARSQLTLQERRLAGLTAYRTEYLQQANEKAQQGMGSASFGRYHAFVGKLDVGIHQQHEQLQRIQQQVEAVRLRWLAQQQRRKALEHLLKKRAEAAKKVKNRQEQLVADEFAMQNFLRRGRT